MNSNPPTLLPWRSIPRSDAPTRFAVIAATLNPSQLKSALKRRRKSIVADIAANRAEIEENIATFASWFGAAGHACPLPAQLERATQQGLSTISGPVDALMYCELTSGILMGVQNLDAIRGDVLFDFAAKGEKFDGFRTTVTCADGEPVVRDQEGIVASVFQGPDRRTSITPDTERLLFYVFDSPSLAATAFDSGVAAVMNVMSDAGGEPAEARSDGPR